MRRFAALAVLLVVALIVTASTAAPPAPLAGPSVAQLKAKIRDLQSDKASLRSDKADLRDQVDAQNLVIGDLQDQNAALRGRIANWPDPLDVITSRGPDGLWIAAQAIWQAFPRLAASDLCGYDKSTSSGPGVGLNLTTFTFSRWTGC